MPDGRKTAIIEQTLSRTHGDAGSLEVRETLEELVQ